jgi:NAD(P)H-nitrite reductase large subunit
MACTLRADAIATPVSPKAMTRCDCAETSFEEIARRIGEEGLTLAECARRTGCGQTCTACLPDLQAYLGASSAR